MDTAQPRQPIIVGTPEWLAERNRRVGGSECQCLFGVRYGITPWQLFQQKSGALPPPDLSDCERVMAGRHLEPGIAAWAVETWHELGPIERCAEYVPHPTVPGMGASLDFRRCEDGAPIEIKNVDFLIWRDQWKCDGETIIEAPLGIELQVQHEMACTGSPYAWIIALVGGNQLYRGRRERRPQTIAIIEAKVAEFWDRVRRNDPPPADYEHDGAAIATLYREANAGEVLDLTRDNRMPELVQALQDARADKKDATDREDAAKAEILHKLGEAEGAWTAGGILVKAATQRRAEYVCKASAFRVIRISGGEEAAPAEAKSSKKVKPTADEMKRAADAQSPL